ncbi:cysteine hydrolase family protein [Thermotoga sp. KOL6]|uniref:cysteine hydrolase family protein n=1 Tax=Thermotoga sp. KOL6 TaxID=126741 RepID=UPI000C77C948|nr:isochorismatase family cysteine hydrolase [Thermotoga sp. KOL6]PLV59200.1 cysteine hydrolase [Thermotoga sp. KOL6]
MKALLVIDIQRDFVDKEGSLYFDGAEKVIEPVLKLVEEFKEHKLPIITTQDWHSLDDPEFNIWPKHCIENTNGARLTERLEKALEGYDLHFPVKKNRYSAFYNTNLEEIIKKNNIDEVFVCGVVTHICVLFTVEELRNREIPVKIVTEGVASYDEELHKFALREMKEILGAELI